jgi:hypothetical protein
MKSNYCGHPNTYIYSAGYDYFHVQRGNSDQYSPVSNTLSTDKCISHNTVLGEQNHCLAENKIQIMAY